MDKLPNRFCLHSTNESRAVVNKWGSVYFKGNWGDLRDDLYILFDINNGYVSSNCDTDDTKIIELKQFQQWIVMKEDYSIF